MFRYFAWWLLGFGSAVLGFALYSKVIAPIYSGSRPPIVAQSGDGQIYTLSDGSTLTITVMRGFGGVGRKAGE